MNEFLDVLATYNRDDNVTGVVQANTFVPEYGSTVSFETQNVHITTADNFYRKFSKNLNGTEINLNLKYSNKTEEEARSFLSFVETVSRSSSGVFNFNTANQGVQLSFPNNIYGPMREFNIQDYSFKFHDGLFDIDLKTIKNGFSSFLNWSGSSYIDTASLQGTWSNGTPYSKFDVVYFPTYNLAGFSNNAYSNFDPTANRIKKFYYCSEDHTSSADTSPTGSNPKFTRSFFYDPDDDVTISTNKKSEINKLKDSFYSFAKTNGNDGLIRDLTLNFKNRTDKEAKSIIHFMEKHENYMPFDLPIPQLYTRRKLFVCKSMTHKFVYKDCNDISITIDEVVKFKTDPEFDNFYYDN